MVRVAGADPGTSSLDLLILEDGAVGDQCRFSPQQLRDDSGQPLRWLETRAPFDLIAGPSGYGLPLVRAQDCTAVDMALISLVRPDERGPAQGVMGFTAVLRTLCQSGLPIVFLPGVLHLPTVPAHRKFNRIDLGTADKLCVAALAVRQLPQTSFCLVELGSAFTACVAVRDGQIVDGVGGTSGPVGWSSGGAWDGELAYLLSPLSKGDLFVGGVGDALSTNEGRAWYRESLVKTVNALRACTPFTTIVLSGRLLETEPAVVQEIAMELSRFCAILHLDPLPGAWVKHAAQGAALLADGLAGGRHGALVEQLALREAGGTVFDWLCHPRAGEIRAAFAK